MKTVLKQNKDLETINKAIDASGVKKKHIAKLLGVNRVSLSYWLNGQRELPKLVKAKLYGMLEL